MERSPNGPPRKNDQKGCTPAKTIKVTSMFWIIDSTAGSTLSNLFFFIAIRAEVTRYRRDYYADPLKQKRNKKVPVIAIISRVPLAIQGYQIKRRESLVTLSLSLKVHYREIA